MVQLLGIGILFMMIANGVVGVRLLLLARRTGQVPELFFGLSLLLLGAVGYPLSILARKAALAGASWEGLLSGALFFQDLACLAMFVATWKTFHPASRWPRRVLVIASAVFAASLLGDSVAARTWAFRDGGPWYELGFWMRALVYYWSAFEAGRYTLLMRRRLRLGLADPVVVDRFRLWTISTCAIAAAFVVFYLGRIFADNVATSAPVLISTSVVGLAAGVTVWLAFVPPDVYLRRVRARAEARA